MNCPYSLQFVYNCVFILQNMFNMEIQTDLSGACTEQCLQKQKMIQKYVKLIDLLKKKNQRSLMSSGRKNSSNILSGVDLKKARIGLSIEKIFNNRKADVLASIKSTLVANTCRRGHVFISLLQKLITKRLSQSTRRIFFIDLGIPLSSSQKRPVLDHQINLSLSLNTTALDRNKTKISLLSRRIFQLSQDNHRLNWSRTSLQGQIDQLNRRINVQSKKKQDSLQMLAQEMGQKNQLILELQSALKYYEERQEKNGNILEENSFVIRQELQKSNKINQKLNIELEKKSLQCTQQQSQIIKLKANLTKIQTQLTQLKEKNFQMTIQLQNVQKRKKQYNSLSTFLQKKLNNLKKYQKVISNNLKVLEQGGDKSVMNSSLRPKAGKQTQDDALQSTPISRFENQYKMEKILNYVYNIEVEDVWISNEENLFDSQQLGVLNQAKLKVMHLNQQIKQLKLKLQDNQQQKISQVAKIKPLLSNKQSQPQQIYCNNNLQGSIFDVLQQDHRASISPDRTNRRGEKGFTLRILQLQIQKNKQVQKISQLKNKIFHIRSIIMNLIKSIELRSISGQSRDIIDVCCQLFEYSQEQKQIIFHLGRKEKKFLGFF